MKIVLTALLLIYSFCSYSQKVRSIETSEMTLIYDTFGQPKQMITRRNEQTDTVNYKNEYDNQDRLISQETFIGPYLLLKTLNRYSENKLVKVENYQRTKFGTVYKYALIDYNESDSVRRKIVFSSGGDTLQSVFKSYNLKNQLSTEIDKDFQHKFLTQKEFTYTSNSKTDRTFCIEIDSKDTIELKELKVVFNKNGDIIKSEEWGLIGSLLMIDGKETSISKEEYRNGLKGYLVVSDFEYKYDKYNKWTQLDYFYNGKQKKKNKTTEKRQITYY